MAELDCAAVVPGVEGARGVVEADVTGVSTADELPSWLLNVGALLGGVRVAEGMSVLAGSDVGVGVVITPTTVRGAAWEAGRTNR
jgi:hypothetical protein